MSVLESFPNEKIQWIYVKYVCISLNIYGRNPKFYHEGTERKKKQLLYGEYLMIFLNPVSWPRIWFLSFWRWPLFKLEAEGNYKVSQTIQTPWLPDLLRLGPFYNKICILNKVVRSFHLQMITDVITNVKKAVLTPICLHSSKGKSRMFKTKLWGLGS